jgi:hypothetical protein
MSFHHVVSLYNVGLVHLGRWQLAKVCYTWSRLKTIATYRTTPASDKHTAYVGSHRRKKPT